MTQSFDVTDQAKARLDPLSKVILDFAFAQADDFINLGQSPREATSIVADLMLRAAWIVAGSGAEADGVTPDPDKFRACVEAALASVSWDRDEGPK